MISPVSEQIAKEVPEPYPIFIVGIMIRVSSDEQAQPDKVSLEKQEKDIRENCNKQGWGIYRVYRDVCTGAIPMEERPAGKVLLKDAEEGRINVVAVWDYDRIGRDRDSLVASIFRSRLRDLGLQVFSHNQPIVLKTPDEFKEDPFDEGAILLEKIHDWDSSTAILKFVRRSIMGKEAAAQKGRLLVAPNYGYRLEPKRDSDGQIMFDSRGRVIRERVADEKEAIVVNRIYIEYVTNGKSDHQITDILNMEGIPSKKGKLWDRQVVARILKQPVYLGFAIYKKTERRKIRSGKQTYKVNPKDKWIVVGPDKSEHPAIIDLKLWEKAQQIRESKKRFAAPSIYSPILFSGLLICGYCKNIMYRHKVNDYNVLKTTGKKVKYVHIAYLCSQWIRFKKCHKNHIGEKTLKQLVLTELKKFKDDPQTLEGYLEEEQNKNVKQDEAVFASKEKGYRQIQKRKQRAYIAYETGATSIDIYNERRDELERSSKQLKEDIETLKVKIANDKLRKATRESFIETIDQLEDIFKDNGNITAQKRFLQSIINNILVQDSRIKINYWLGSEKIQT